MNYYGARFGHRPASDDPDDYYCRRHQRRREAMLALSLGRPTLELVADHEHLIDCYRRLEARGGRAPGPDRISYEDLTPAEIAILMREAGEAILRGDYRPGPARKVAIPKASGGTRTLTVANIVDRDVGAALADVLTPTFEDIFLAGSFGFRPRLGTWHLLAALAATMVASQITTLATEDVKKAFDNVPIAILMEIFKESIEDRRLLDLIETVLRGGEDRGRAAGIPQGNPFSPLALNVILHKIHDVPFSGDAANPPWFRYADNLAYACHDVSEGRRILDRVRKHLAPAGLQLKGADGPPIDLRHGEAQLLGFRLTFRENRLQASLGEGAWHGLGRGLEEAHAGSNPPRTARDVVGGWIDAYGPAFESGKIVARTVGEIRKIGAAMGFLGLGPTEDLRGRCSKAYSRWIAHREGAIGRWGAGKCLHGEGVAAPPATTETGER